MYTESEATLHPTGLPSLKLRQETTFPSDGEVIIHVDPASPARFPLHLRIPPYAEGALAQTNNGEQIPAPAGDFLTIEREWQPGDQIKLSLPMPLRCQANDYSTAVVRGPLVYAYFQNAQSDSGIIYQLHQGLYPADALLELDPNQPGDSVSQEAAQDGLLGPLLKVPGRILMQAPMFADNQGNAEIAPSHQESLVLLPFVNQGAIGGDYRVFMAYER